MYKFKHVSPKSERAFRSVSIKVLKMAVAIAKPKVHTAFTIK